MVEQGVGPNRAGVGAVGHSEVVTHGHLHPSWPGRRAKHGAGKAEGAAKTKAGEAKGNKGRVQAESRPQGETHSEAESRTEGEGKK